MPGCSPESFVTAPGGEELKPPPGWANLVIGKLKERESKWLTEA